MKIPKLLICAISVVAALAASKVGAQTITATLIGNSPAMEVNGTVDGFTFDNYPAGVMNFTYDGDSSFQAFCVEPSQDIGFSETVVYQIQNPINLASSDKIAQLIGGYLLSDQDATNAAAVQWAIWEVTSEILAPPSLIDGNVRITTPAYQTTADLADDYLTNIDSFVPVDLVYLTNGTRQNVVSWTVGIVPEPGSTCLVAFSALALLRRRR